MVKTRYVTRGTTPSTVLTGFEKVLFNCNDGDKQNLPPVPQSVVDEYESKGRTNGRILSCFSYFESRPGVLGLNYGTSRFFRTNHYSDSRMLAVNAVMDFGDHTLLIKRPEDVYGYPGWFDFPAGLVPFQDGKNPKAMMLDRLEDRIEKDTNLPLDSMTIGNLLPLAIDSGSNALCFFYPVKCDLSLDKAKYYTEELGEQEPHLIPKKELGDFLKSHDVIFPEAFGYAFPGFSKK